jgi:hypothetical protein
MPTWLFLTTKGGIMKFGKRSLTFVFALFMLMGTYVYSAQAQTGRVIVVRRPVVVRPYYNPYWGARAWRYYDPFYADLYKSPYERYLEEKWYAERELAGNQRELQEHQQKYRADGFISPKEQKELQDDIKDVQKARARLNRLNRSY